MHNTRILSNFLNVKNTIIKNVELEQNNTCAVFKVRPAKKADCRCGKCGRRSSVYDSGRKETRRWRGRDWNGTTIFLESELKRVKCRKCGVVTQQVPWARHKSGFTYDFEQEIVWLALHMSKSALSKFRRIAWKTVGEIIERVYTDLEKKSPCKFDNLSKIGIDETSYRKGHKYITVVVNHDTGKLIWAREGHSTETLSEFFEQLTNEQRESINLVTGDGARWIKTCVEKYCPNAES